MKGIDVQRDFDGLEITYNRVSFSSLFLIPMIYFASLIFFCIHFLTGFHWISIFFILIYLIGTNFICAQSFNRTVINLNTNRIQISHKPFLLLSNKHVIYKKDIQQIFVRYISKRGYNLGILSTINAEYIIIPDIKTFEQSSFIERKIKFYLGLEDV